MKIFLYFLLSAYILFGCSQQEPGTDDPPQAVQMIHRELGSDTLETERGTDAYASAENKIQVMWFSHPEKDKITQFKIYRSEEPDGSRKYVHHGTISIANVHDQDTVFIDQVNINTSYYYYVTVLTENGLESAPSDTTWYQLVSQAELDLPGAVVTNDTIHFHWHDGGYIPNDYILRVEKSFNLIDYSLVYVDLVYSDYKSNVEVLVSGDWISEASPMDQFRWRIDCIGGDELHIGSESNWRLFTINLN